MSEHKPEKKAEMIIRAAKSKPGTGKVSKGELSDKDLEKVAGGRKAGE